MLDLRDLRQGRHRPVGDQQQHALPQRAAGQRRLLSRLRLRLADGRGDLQHPGDAARHHPGRPALLPARHGRRPARASRSGRSPTGPACAAGRRARAGWCCCPATAAAASSRSPASNTDRCAASSCTWRRSSTSAWSTSARAGRTRPRWCSRRPPPTALRNVRTRWLVFHRWTRQHVLAASGLVYGERGILRHRRPARPRRARSWPTRCASSAPRWSTPTRRSSKACAPAQVAWLRDVDRDLSELASGRKVGRTLLLGIDPARPGPAVA